jgi:hypothetical protein
MFKRSPAAPLTAVLLTATLAAQVAHAPMRISGPPAGSFPHSRTPRALYAGFPLWAHSYLPPYDGTPSVIVVQAPAPPPERAITIPDEPRSAAPLLIEWQGDRYVRRTSATTSSSRAEQPDYIADVKARSVAKHAAPRSSELQSNQAFGSSGPRLTREPASLERSAKSSDLPPTTFIFRDGHREDSSDYSIISGVIYARGDYWSTGSWSRQIKLSQLDLPATIKANQDRGVSFRLPTASNEVITRP